jgi:hypothetical protein
VFTMPGVRTVESREAPEIAGLYVCGDGAVRLLEKPKRCCGRPDAMVRVTLASICTLDLHIKHGPCPGRCPGSRGHEMVVLWRTRAPVKDLRQWTGWR